jgi:hypothetical protein
MYCMLLTLQRNIPNSIMSDPNKIKIIEEIVQFSLLPYSKTHNMELTDLIQMLYDNYIAKTLKYYENYDFSIKLEDLENPVNPKPIENTIPKVITKDSEKEVTKNRGRGRPKGSLNNPDNKLKIKKPNNGEKKGRGRPKGSLNNPDNKLKIKKPNNGEKKGRGRPKGSLNNPDNKLKIKKPNNGEKKGRGRPKGSLNNPDNKLKIKKPNNGEKKGPVRPNGSKKKIEI